MPNAVVAPPPDQEEVVTSPPGTVPVLEGEALDAALRAFIEVGGTEQFLYELGTGVQTVETLNLLYTGGGTTDTLEHHEGPFPGGDQLANWAAANATALAPDLDTTGPLTPVQLAIMQAHLQLLANGGTLNPSALQSLQGYIDRYLQNAPQSDVKKLNEMLELINKGIDKVPVGRPVTEVVDLYNQMLELADKLLAKAIEADYVRFSQHMANKPPGMSVQDYLNQFPSPSGAGLTDQLLTRWLIEEARKKLLPLNKRN